MSSWSRTVLIKYGDNFTFTFIFLLLIFLLFPLLFRLLLHLLLICFVFSVSSSYFILTFLPIILSYSAFPSFSVLSPPPPFIHLLLLLFFLSVQKSFFFVFNALTHTTVHSGSVLKPRHRLSYCAPRATVGHEKQQRLALKFMNTQITVVPFQTSRNWDAGICEIQ